MSHPWCKGVGNITKGCHVNQIMIGKYIILTGLLALVGSTQLHMISKAHFRMFLVWKATILETKYNAADNPSNHAMKDRFACITPHEAPAGLWC